MAIHAITVSVSLIRCKNESLKKIARQYAVKAQTSLHVAPLSRFCGSRVITAHAHQCCIFKSYAKTAVANEID